MWWIISRYFGLCSSHTWNTKLLENRDIFWEYNICIDNELLNWHDFWKWHRINTLVKASFSKAALGYSIHCTGWVVKRGDMQHFQFPAIGSDVFICWPTGTVRTGYFQQIACHVRCQLSDDYFCWKVNLWTAAAAWKDVHYEHSHILASSASLQRWAGLTPTCTRITVGKAKTTPVLKAKATARAALWVPSEKGPSAF